MTVNKEQQEEINNFSFLLRTHAHTGLKEVPGKDSAIVDFTTQPSDKSTADGFAFLSFLNSLTHTLAHTNTQHTMRCPARHMIKKAF